jgi:hypothetical protein
MLFGSNPEFVEIKEMCFQTFPKVHLPIPEKYYVLQGNNSVKTEFCTIQKSINIACKPPLFEDFNYNKGKAQIVDIQFTDVFGQKNQQAYLYPFTSVIEPASSYTPNQLQNEFTNHKILLQNQDTHRETQMLLASEQFNHRHVPSTNPASEENTFEACQSSKVPTKDDLYKLSILIQDTNYDFDIYKTGHLQVNVDTCYLTSNGLYVSKNISGFNWSFEIFFEKNTTTNRNRRQLRCRHGDCQKVFKKAWNLFDHMRIHTGKKPFS